MLIFDQSRWEEGRAYIEQMKKDGGDHRQFFLEKNELIAGSKLATDGENLFFMKWVYEMDKGATLQNPSALVLAKMDLKTGKVEDIERFAAKPSTHINGVLDDCLVLENRGNANPQSASTHEDRIINTIQWILFNPATKVKKEMGSWDFPAKSLQLHEGKLYELDTNTGLLTETVLATGARRTLLEDKSKGQFPQIPAEAKAYLHPEIVDGHIQVNFITPGKKLVNIAYNLATGKAAEVTRPELERIVSQSDTAYHVIIGYQAYNGDTHFAQTVERTALIEKDWYWTSRVGYLPIADQVPPVA